MSTLANGQWETPVLGSNTKFINACSCTSSVPKASALKCHWSLPLSPAIHNLDFGYFVTMLQNISDQQGEQMGSWAGWDGGEVVWTSPPAPVSRSLRFQGSINPRAGVFLPVSISCIRMCDLLISIIHSPHLPGPWWCLSLAFFLICGAHLSFCNIYQIFELLKYLSLK